jgi:hypothetical protein
MLSGMKPIAPSDFAHASAAYVACRRGGAPPERARQELALAPPAASRLERMLRTKGGGPQSQRPRFARHELHVAAVLAAGGFSVLRRP